MKLMIDIPDYDLNDIQNGSIACGQVLKAVKNGTPVTTDEDLISREALKTTINSVVDEEIRFEQAWAMGLKYSLKIINKAPTVEITDYDTGYQDGLEDGLNDIRPQGEWIDCKNIPYLANCSHCGYQMDTHEERGYFKFCPYCGARMGGDTE